MADITGEDEWSDWENEEIPAKSLLEDRILPSAQVISLFTIFSEYV